jgi:HNH endonuclease
MEPNIKGFPNYHITEEGKVINLRTGKSLKGVSHSDGYIVFCLSNNGKQKVLKQHRLLALAYIPNPEGKLYVHHIDSDRSNNALSNLEWVTPKQNMDYKVEAGRDVKREPVKHYIEVENEHLLTRKQRRFVEVVNRLNYIEDILDELGIKERAFYHMLARVKERLASASDG